MVSPQITKGSLRRAGMLQLGRTRIARIAVVILFVACLLTTLTAGLWPFSSPRNDAMWVPGSTGINFGSHGTAVSNAPLNITAGGSQACSVELWLQPARMWNTGVPVSFYNSQTRRMFVIKQEFLDLVLQLEDPERPGSDGIRSFVVADVFRKPAFLLAITSDGQKTSIYVDGRLLAESPNFPLSSQDLSGRLILGNAPLRNHNWPGVVRGVAVYSNALSGEQVLASYREWTKEPESQVAISKDLRALYLFREHSGNVVHDSITPGVNLEITEKFVTIDQLRFERPSSEIHADSHYRDDIVVNIVGFIPLGFVTALFFAMFCGARRAVILAVMVAEATSLTIEYFQAYLPTRYSGVTDLITNPLGACIGAILYCAVARLAAKKMGLSDPHA